VGGLAPTPSRCVLRETRKLKQHNSLRDRALVIDREQSTISLLVQHFQRHFAHNDTSNRVTPATDEVVLHRTQPCQTIDAPLQEEHLTTRIGGRGSCSRGIAGLGNPTVEHDLDQTEVRVVEVDTRDEPLVHRSDVAVLLRQRERADLTLDLRRHVHLLRITARAIDGVEHIVEVLRRQDTVVASPATSGIRRVGGDEGLEATQNASRARSGGRGRQSTEHDSFELDGEPLDSLLNLVGIDILEARSRDGPLGLGDADILTQNHGHVEHAVRDGRTVQRPVGTFHSARGTDTGIVEASEEGVREPLVVNVLTRNLRSLTRPGRIPLLLT